MKYVEAEGSPAAEIVFIGEAPAATEVATGRPFTGSAGQFFDKLVSLAGLYRGEVYITNICKHQVPGNKMSRLPYEELINWRAKLIEEINSLDGPKVIVPLGRYALESVSNKSGITNYRGSPLPPKDSIKHNCIVVPTFHPSSMHYGEKYNDWPLIVADLVKAKRIRDEGFEFPTYQFITKPTLREVLNTLDMLVKKDLFVTIDVETPHYLLSCIGIGWSRSEAICIPFFMGNGSNYWSFGDEMVVWKKLGEVLPQLNWGNQMLCLMLRFFTSIRSVSNLPFGTLCSCTVAFIVRCATRLMLLPASILIWNITNVAMRKRKKKVHPSERVRRWIIGFIIARIVRQPIGLLKN